MNNNPNPKSSASQCARIYKYLLEGKTISNGDAYFFFECNRLAARIYDIKMKHNVEINSRFVETMSGKRVKEYWIEKE